MELINTVLLNTLPNSCRLGLFKEVQNFIHLNVATAFFVGYLAYVTGIELGARNEVMIIIKTMYIFIPYFNIFLK